MISHLTQEMIVRSVALTHGLALVVSAAATGIVMLIGAYLIRRYRPPAPIGGMQGAVAIHQSTDT